MADAAALSSLLHRLSECEKAMGSVSPTGFKDWIDFLISQNLVDTGLTQALRDLAARLDAVLLKSSEAASEEAARPAASASSRRTSLETLPGNSYQGSLDGTLSTTTALDGPNDDASSTTSATTPVVTAEPAAVAPPPPVLEPVANVVSSPAPTKSSVESPAPDNSRQVNSVAPSTASTPSNGLVVSEECVALFQELKIRKKHRFIVYRIEASDFTLVPETVGARDMKIDDLFNALRASECRYVVYDHQGERNDQYGKRVVDKAFFIMWAPTAAPTNLKMLYSTERKVVNRTFVGVEDFTAAKREDIQIGVGAKSKLHNDAADSDDEDRHGHNDDWMDE